MWYPETGPRTPDSVSAVPDPGGVANRSSAATVPPAPKYNPAMPRIYLERRDLGDELRRVFDLLNDEAQAAGTPGECNPPLDVVESAAAIELVMDLPGVERDHLQVFFARGTLLIAGTKRAAACTHDGATFHLAERAFGRFARAVRISAAVDAGRARATLSAGELRIVFPRIDDRRGREIRIPIETD